MNRGFNHTLRVTIANTASTAAAGVVATLTLPASFTFVSTTAASYSFSSQVLTVTVGSVSTGTTSFDVVVTPTEVGSFESQVEITTTSTDDNLADNLDTLVSVVEDTCAITTITDGGGNSFECYPEGAYENTMQVTGTGLTSYTIGENPAGPFGDTFEDYLAGTYAGGSPGASVTGYGTVYVGDGP